MCNNALQEAKGAGRIAEGGRDPRLMLELHGNLLKRVNAERDALTIEVRAHTHKHRLAAWH
jgi:hypothetical protein